MRFFSFRNLLMKLLFCPHHNSLTIKIFSLSCTVLFCLDWSMTENIVENSLSLTVGTAEICFHNMTAMIESKIAINSAKPAQKYLCIR